MSTWPTSDASAPDARPKSAAGPAAAALGVPPGAPPAAARAAFLRRLSSAGLVPPPEWRSAVRTLTGYPACGPAALADAGTTADQGLRAEVEAFAEAFWSLTPAARRACWQALLDRCSADLPLATRLRRLEAGVDLESIPPGGDRSRSEELAGMVQALFVLKPAARAARRREQIATLRAPASAWADAARQLLEYQPARAALEPALIERLTTPPRPARRRAAAAAKPTWGFRVHGGLQVPCAPQPRQSARWWSEWANPNRWVFALFLLASALLGAFTQSLRENYRPAPDVSASPSYMPLTPWRPSNAPPQIGSTTIEDSLRSSQPQPPANNGPGWLLIPNSPPGRSNEPTVPSTPAQTPPAPPVPPGGGGP
jgi:hypothetical protein